MNKDYTKSLEGWNFDKLGNHFVSWTRVGNMNLYLSESKPFIKGELIQAVKSYDRVVGLIMFDENGGLMYELGKWSRTTSAQLTKLARMRHVNKIPVEVLGISAIDALQDGLLF